jgi:hypothetical protein
VFNKNALVGLASETGEVLTLVMCSRVRAVAGADPPPVCAQSRPVLPEENRCSVELWLRQVRAGAPHANWSPLTASRGADGTADAEHARGAVSAGHSLASACAGPLRPARGVPPLR